MSPRSRAILQILVLIVFAGLLFLFFPPAVVFLELAARELRVLWWLVLLVALAVWLIWGISRRPK
ncbi:MAG TPA: hypothetical protein VK633_01405 [Verrucomicrobiae bacterium]|nr:hypothetical protein [Verrucomicrobiae bacterium]